MFLMMITYLQQRERRHSVNLIGSESSYAVTKRNANDNLVVQGPFSTSRKLGTRVRVDECKRNIISVLPRYWGAVCKFIVYFTFGRFSLDNDLFFYLR